jgi:hypothetical protein
MMNLLKVRNAAANPYVMRVMNGSNGLNVKMVSF